MPTNIDSSDVKHIPLLGKVACGQPIMVIENIEAMYKIPKRFCGSGELFMLRAEGDSMIGANIFEGDYLIVRKQYDAENGDIVIACKVSDNSSDEEATCKRYRLKGGKPILQPENEKYEDIDASKYRIIGKVKSIVRDIETFD